MKLAGADIKQDNQGSCPRPLASVGPVLGRAMATLLLVRVHVDLCPRLWLAGRQAGGLAADSFTHP